MAAAYSGEAARLKRVAVDLTPLLPGGDNGGAKPLAIELVRRLAAMSETQGRPCEFVLLTSEKSDGELAVLDAPNVRRLCVSRPHNAPTLPRRRTLRVRATLRALLARGARRALPQKLARRIGEWYARTPEGSPPSTPLLRAVAADLLFCPFTGALFFDPAVPVVSLVHDLQYLYYPEFFDPADRHERDRHFRQVCRVASRLICVSEYTRASVLEHSGLSPERVVAIPSAPHKRLPAPAPRTVERVLSGLRLVPGRYLLYPANFWRHKNHELLLTAFGIYRAAHSQSDLKLVLTGSPSPRREELMEATRRMGLSAWVVFAGYLPDEDFAALLAGSAALLFPSLFEGFGMPVLEAMAAGVPVACGNLTSLPEIAGPPGRPAALLFDPRRPAGIAAAIERLESDPALRAGLIERGRRRAADFLTPEEWAARYFAVFQEAAGPRGHRPFVEDRPSAVYGVFPDAWTGGRVTVVYGQGPTPRRLTVTLRAPEWLPSARVAIRVGVQVHRIPRGQRKTITLDLPGQAGVVELLCSPTFQPGGEDLRQLGCLLESAAIGGPGETDPRQLPREAHAA